MTLACRKSPPGVEVELVRFGVLGPVAILADPPIEAGGPQLRRLLGVLVLHADRVVSTDRLASIVFGDSPSDTAATNVRSYIARLRRVLADDGSGTAIVTDPPGYRLDLRASTIDAIEFEAALDEARVQYRLGESERAIAALERGLALWRGDAYAGFEDEEWAMADAQRLEELRLGAEELRGEALVSAGRYREAIAGLHALFGEHPLRGSAASILMISLYRSDRQTEALRVAQDHRDALVDAGLEPTPDLVDLEQRIAAHDVSLRARPGAGPHHVRSYALLDDLGVDDLGVVHRAVQSGVGREVAVTQLAPEVADHPDFVRQFEQLVHRVVQLEHPNVLPILDAWREPGAAFLVTPVVRAATFDDVLAKGPCALDRVVAVVEAVASALHSAHDFGLAHGVLTAGHLLLDDDDRVFVSGIGISALAAAVSGGDAPSGEYGPAHDQASLASLARRALTGDRAEAGDPPRGTAVSHARPELLALDGVFARAGATTPEDRYPDIEVFASAFVAAAGTDVVDRRDAADVTNPYKGLLAFGEADAADYHGRVDAVEQLFARVLSPDVSARFVTVIGPSGSGKSSLVRAGLVPRLRGGPSDGSGSWLVTTMIPGRSPFTELGRALEAIAVGPRRRLLDPAVDGVAPAVRRAVPDGATLVLVIDQLEELFTLAPADERRSFVSGLVAAVRDPGSGIRVVATLRADFYDRPLVEPELGDLVAAGTFPLVAMRPTDIESAVVAPARSRGVEIDGRVVAEIVGDVSSQDNALPLLQYCLTELFDRRSGAVITLEDYEDLGGIAGAIADAAEDRYRRADPEEQHAIRQVMLRLVVVGEDRTDLRRRTPRGDLLDVPGSAAVVNRVLELFGRARLLAFDRDPTTRQETVEVAHEALLRSWPRLQHWVRDAGRALVVREEVTVAAKAWRDRGEDPADLARGTRLLVAEEWAEDHGELVGAVERRYLDESIAARQVAEERDREIAARQRRTNRLLRRSLSAVAVLLAVATAAFAVAVVQRTRADDRAAEADQARARTLAVTAGNSVAEDRSLALLLAVEATRISDTPETRRALFEALHGGGRRMTRTVIPTPATDYVALAVSADQRLAAARRADGSVDLVDLVERRVRTAGLDGPVRPAGGIDLDAEGRLLAMAGTDDGPVVIVRDVEDGTVLAELRGGSTPVPDAQFTPDGTELVVAEDTDAVVVYDVSSWAVARRLPVSGPGEVTAFDITEDGSRLVVATSPFGATLADAGPASLSVIGLDDGEVLAGPTELETDIVGAVDVIDALDAVVVGDERVRVLDLTTLEPAIDPLGDSFLGYADVAFGANGFLVAGSEVDLDAFVDVGGSFEPVDLPIDAAAPGLALSDDGSTMVTADAGGTVSTWTTGWIVDVGEPAEPVGPGLLDVSPDRDTVTSFGMGRGVRILDAATLSERGSLDIGSDRSILGVAFDPAGERLVTATCPFDEEPSCLADIQLWDAATLESIAGPVDIGPVWWAASEAVAFTADGGQVVSAGFDGSVRRWDARSLEEVLPGLRPDDVAPFPGDEVRQVATAMVDGRSLVIAKGELSEAVVWDVSAEEAASVGVLSGGLSDVGVGPAGLLVAAQGRGTFRLHDAQTLAPQGDPFMSSINSSWFRDFGTVLVSSGGFGTQLWDIPSRMNLTGPMPSATAVLAPDGAALHLGGVGRGDAAGGVIRIMPLDTTWLEREACRRAGRNLTDQERAVYLPGSQSPVATCPEWPVAG